MGVKLNFSITGRGEAFVFRGYESSLSLEGKVIGVLAYRSVSCLSPAPISQACLPDRRRT